MANNLTTLSHKLRIARNEADEDAALLDLTSAGDHPNMPEIIGATGVGVVDILSEKVVSTTETEVGALHFLFSGGSAAGKTFGFRLLTWGNSNYPAKLTAVGTGILGTQAVVTYPHNGSVATSKFWADTLVLTWTNWFKGMKSTDITGHNTYADVWFDAAGFRYWKIEITDADGTTGTEAGGVACYYGYW